MKDLNDIQDFIFRLKEALIDEEYTMASIITGALGQHIVTLMNLKLQGINYHGREDQEDTINE